MATASARLHEVMEQLTSKKITERKKAVDAVGALLSEDRRDALADGSWVLLARHAITCADHELAAAIKAKKPPRGEVGSLVANVVKWSDELRAAARTPSTRRGLDAAART